MNNEEKKLMDTYTHTHTMCSVIHVIVLYIFRVHESDQQLKDVSSVGRGVRARGGWAVRYAKGWVRVIMSGSTKSRAIYEIFRTARPRCLPHVPGLQDR